MVLGGTTSVTSNYTLKTNTGVLTFANGTASTFTIVTDCCNFWRVGIVVTNNATGNTSFRLTVQPTTTSVNFELWGYQIETSGSPTSLIQTSGAAGTRYVDLCTITDLTKLGLTTAVMNAGFTLYVEGDGSNPQWGGTLLSISDGTDANSIDMWPNTPAYSGLKPNSTISVGGVAAGADGANNTPIGSTVKMALAYTGAGTWKLACSGRSDVQTITNGLPPVTTAYIGRRFAGEGLTGHVGKVATYQFVLSDAQLLNLVNS